MNPTDIGVRERLENLAPAANIGHRGTGQTRPFHPFPENSLSSFLEAARQGANGIELDLEIAEDGTLLVMHDDTLDRTTNCSGCVSGKTREELGACRLLNGWKKPTSEIPPTLEEVYATLPDTMLVNVELKVYGSECRTETTVPVELARAAAAAVRRLGVARRTFFSSFDEEALGTLKSENPDLYSALLLNRDRSEQWSPALERALDLGLDAIHPHESIPQAGVEAALNQGLQVNVYTVNLRTRMNAVLDVGVTSIITDQPGVLREVIEERELSR